MLRDAQGSYDAFAENLETWYNDQMDRVSGWYKAHATCRIWWIAIAIVLCFNVDTIFITKTLWNNPNLRSEVVNQTQPPTPQTTTAPSPKVGVTRVASSDASWERGAIVQTRGAGSATTPPLAAEDRCAALMGLNGQQTAKNPFSVPVGWNALTLCDQPTWFSGSWFWWAVVKVIGFLLSVVAIVQGAPFWFQVLNQVINVRYSGPVSHATAQGAGVTGTAKTPARTPA
jgi:hypothetical protein